MSVSYNSLIPTKGLKFLIDPANLTKMGSSPYKELTKSTTVTNTAFTQIDNIWRSDANSTTGAGTSNLAFSNISIATGSFTMAIWLKVTSNPDTGVNNNWRSVFMNGGTGQDPFGILMEEGRDMQFTITTAVGAYRYLGGTFTQFNCTLNQWFQVVFAYDSASGTGFAYRNGALVRSGRMSTTSDTNVTYAVPGEAVKAMTTGMTYEISNSNNVSDPSGAGCFPGDIGPALLYDRAISAAEVYELHLAYKDRFGL
jgi:hypothetical protein